MSNIFGLSSNVIFMKLHACVTTICLLSSTRSEYVHKWVAYFFPKNKKNYSFESFAAFTQRFLILLIAWHGDTVVKCVYTTHSFISHNKTIYYRVIAQWRDVLSSHSDPFTHQRAVDCWDFSFSGSSVVVFAEYVAPKKFVAHLIARSRMKQ